MVTTRWLARILAWRDEVFWLPGPLVEPRPSHADAGALPRLLRRSERVALLARLGRTLADGEVLRVPVRVDDDLGLPAHVAIDGARALLRRLGVDVAEPGDRSNGQHRYFRAEELEDEARAAGLVLAGCEAGCFLLMRQGDPNARAWLPRERRGVRRDTLFAAFALVPRVQRWMRDFGPERAIEAARARGRHAKRHAAGERRALRWAVAWVDAFSPGRGGCYRRTLLEIALDSGAAEETVFLGLDVGKTGHAWLASAADEQRPFDVVFEVPAGVEGRR
jgi:hypothetical protein